MLDPISAWNDEYNRRGIPSSHRDEPSGVVKWALSNLPYLESHMGGSALDLGCGTGRNSLALVEAGYEHVSAMDFSSVALETARKRPGAHAVDFQQGDVTKPLPFSDNTYDLATDVFVYFHQLADRDRLHYRREIHRVLKPRGILLISLATSGDGYYSSCSTGPLDSTIASCRLTWDPVAEVGNILLAIDELRTEFSDLFDLQMTWVKQKPGVMHGTEYTRETVASLWRAKD